MTILTKNDIIEIQRHCYGKLEERTVLQGGVEVTLKVGSMISDSSYFDIHKFAEAVEKAVLDRITKPRVAYGLYEKLGGWTPEQIAALNRLPDGCYELRSPPLSKET